MNILVNGRLSWRLILAIVYITIVLIVTDYTWRIVEAPFINFLVADLLALSLGLWLILRIGRNGSGKLGISRHQS